MSVELGFGTLLVDCGQFRQNICNIDSLGYRCLLGFVLMDDGLGDGEEVGLRLGDPGVGVAVGAGSVGVGVGVSSGLHALSSSTAARRWIGLILRADLKGRMP